MNVSGPEDTGTAERLTVFVVGEQAMLVSTAESQRSDLENDAVSTRVSGPQSRRLYWTDQGNAGHAGWDSTAAPGALFARGQV